MRHMQHPVVPVIPIDPLLLISAGSVAERIGDLIGKAKLAKR